LPVGITVVGCQLKGIAMPLILLILVLVVLRFFEVWKFAALSWWWIIGLMVAGFVWFEFIEKMLNLDKKKAHAEDEKRRKARVKQSFDKRR
jgi:small Trp-rich protein